MATDGMPARQIVILGLLLVALAAVVAYNLGGDGPAGPASVASNRQRGRAAPAGTATPTPREQLDVRLEALTSEKPQPQEADRNPFRFRPKPPPAPPQPNTSARPTPTMPLEPSEPPGPARPPPITLKFIGVIESPRKGKIAALFDPNGKFVVHGREGDIIEGRYRIVRIGVESIVMEYADGRGRTTIRLTG